MEREAIIFVSGSVAVIASAISVALGVSSRRLNREARSLRKKAFEDHQCFMLGLTTYAAQTNAAMAARIDTANAHADRTSAFADRASAASAVSCADAAVLTSDCSNSLVADEASASGYGSVKWVISFFGYGLVLIRKPGAPAVAGA